MYCWLLQPCAAHPGISAQQTHAFCWDYWGLRLSEMSCHTWAGRDSQWQDGSLGLWPQVTKWWILATSSSIQRICAVWLFSLLAQGWGLARVKVPRSWRPDKLHAAAKGGCGSFLPALCFLLCCCLPKLPGTGFFTSGRGVTSRDI